MAKREGLARREGQLFLHLVNVFTLTSYTHTHIFGIRLLIFKNFLLFFIRGASKLSLSQILSSYSLHDVAIQIIINVRFKSTHFFF